MGPEIICEWLRREVGIEAAQKGLGKKCSEFLAEFYADDGIIANREPERLQQSLDALVALFERVGLITNTEKTKAMTMIPGKIRTRLIEEVYANSIEGLVDRGQLKQGA